MTSNSNYKCLTPVWLRLFILASVLPWTALTSACVEERREGGQANNTDARQAERMARSSAPGPICADAAATNFDVYLDASGSPASELNRKAARNLYNELPTIIAGRCVKRLRVFLFAEDGWNPREERTLQLPTVTVRAINVEGGGEIGRLGIGAQEEREKLAAECAAAENDARSDYGDKLAKALKEVSEDWFMPPNSPPGGSAPRRTDLRGLFHLITETPSSTPRTVLVITDGHHTADSPLDRVTKPETLTLIIMLVSEKNKDGYEDYALRRKEMLNVCSEALVIPYSQEDFSFLIPMHHPFPMGKGSR